MLLRGVGQGCSAPEAPGCGAHGALRSCGLDRLRVLSAPVPGRVPSLSLVTLLGLLPACHNPAWHVTYVEEPQQGHRICPGLGM